MKNPISFIKNKLKKLKPQDIGIKAIVKTNYPEVFKYYYETFGYESDIFHGRDGTYLIVWKKGFKDKDKIIEKLGKIV